MPLKMVGFILVLVILVIFVGLNWSNTSNIDLWFNQTLHFDDVPIVLSFLVVFLLGMLSSIPFWLDRSIKKKRKEKSKKKESPKSDKKEKKPVPEVEISNIYVEEELSEEDSAL